MNGALFNRLVSAWGSPLTLLAATILLGLCSCATSSQVGSLQRYEFERPQMGLPFRMVLYASSGHLATNAAGAAYARIKELNDILSDYDEASELSRLSKSSGQSKRVRVSDDLWKVLIAAQEMSQRSQGAFDITVGPLVDLWKRARRQRELPATARLEEARTRVGYRKVLLYPATREVELLTPGMRLDLGAIAKGYALDEGLRVLRKHGIPRAMLSGGGDMAFAEPPPGKRGWKVELASLDSTNAPSSQFLELRNGGLATSGDLFQHVVIGGKRYSHIVDPRTGVGLTDHSLVVVTAPKAMLADALSTAVSVLGPKEGLKLIESNTGAAVRIVRNPNGQTETSRSRGFPAR